MNALAPPPQRFTSAEFRRLLQAGGFGCLRVELREGMIVKMSPQHLPDSRSRRLLARALETAIAQAGLELVADEEVNIAFGAGFEPLTDIVVWEGPAGGGVPAGPIPGAAVRLIEEVADTSLADDMGAKRAAYTAAGLAEYWVADLTAKALHRHDAPTADGYRQAASATFGAAAASLTLPVTVETGALR